MKNTLLFRLSYSQGIEKYFNNNYLVFQYDKKIDDICPSIMNIPAIATLITVAWATGAEIDVKTIDESYFESLNEIKPIMETWYPWFSFSTRINFSSTVKNRFSNKGYGLLFTGGIDSTASYIRHRDQRPILISVWGTGKYIHPRIETVELSFNRFAIDKGIRINFVSTNFENVINFSLLREKFGLDWYIHVFHSIALTGLCAPLTCFENIQTLLLASTLTKECNIPWGSHPLIDNKIRWADVNVIHDGYELDRQEKISKIIKPYILKTGDFPKIRTCVRKAGTNCGQCEKCLRTIMGFVLEDIDPNKCGFHNVNAETFNFIEDSPLKMHIIPRQPFYQKRPKNIFQTAIKGLSLEDFRNIIDIAKQLNRIVSMVEWRYIQKHIPKTVDNKLFGSKLFFEWFDDFDISGEDIKTPKSLFFYFLDSVTLLYQHVPKNIQKIARQTILKLLKRLSSKLSQ